MSVLGEHVRAQRLRHGVSQRSLAIRAGTTQAAVSRIERGELSPGIATVEQLLSVLGETLELTARPLQAEHDAAHLADLRARSPADRLALAMSWNRLAGEVALAGARARRRSV